MMLEQKCQDSFGIKAVFISNHALGTNIIQPSFGFIYTQFMSSRALFYYFTFIFAVLALNFFY
jgi:hypothetical protein